ncbi:hypothetical protein CPter291_4914 [Collimonas pratensis]|uniref:Uncharacterized protein n=1 Tax=Collimonas pratensis TaxID=279113 RepID=A0ABM5ZDW5_9BURK|nr:hypothetical protein CPter291_4914 [Collimonas pratensis]
MIQRHGKIRLTKANTKCSPKSHLDGRKVGTACPRVTAITGVRPRVAPKQACNWSEFTRGHAVPTVR